MNIPEVVTIRSDNTFINTGTTNSGTIGENTGSTNTGMILISTGEVITYTETGSLTPLEMYYSDSDTDGKIDTLEIYYPYTLSGHVNTGAISLYSNTG